MRLFATILFIFAFAMPAFALDGSFYIESDTAQTQSTLDFQANIGQVFGDIYRVYASAERTRESSLFPNSDNNYRIGVEDNYFLWLKLEAGAACYKDSPYFYSKATYQFDTGKKP